MYKFDPKTDKYAFYHDYSWNHPSMEGIEPMNCDVAAWEILDPKKTLEEQLATQVGFQQAVSALFPPVSDEAKEKLTIEERYIPGLNPEDPDVRIVILTPNYLTKKKNPAVVHFYGGGMIMGTPESQLYEIADLCLKLDCIGVSVDYRLLPKWTYPAAVDDGEAAVKYILENQKELRIDPSRMCVYGQSAGAYMSACTSYRLKMRGEYQFAGQMLVYPVIDDSFNYPSSNIFYGEVWHAIDDQKVFAALLGPEYNRAMAPADAVPSHTRDFTGLPPTAIITGDLDYGHDAVIEYAQGLMNAHIFCDIHVFGGVFHGFIGMGVGTDVSNRGFREIAEHLADFITGKCVRE